MPDIINAERLAELEDCFDEHTQLKDGTLIFTSDLIHTIRWQAGEIERLRAEMERLTTPVDHGNRCPGCGGEPDNGLKWKSREL